MATGSGGAAGGGAAAKIGRRRFRLHRLECRGRGTESRGDAAAQRIARPQPHLQYLPKPAKMATVIAAVGGGRSIDCLSALRGDGGVKTDVAAGDNELLALGR